MAGWQHSPAKDSVRSPRVRLTAWRNNAHWHRGSLGLDSCVASVQARQNGGRSTMLHDNTALRAAHRPATLHNAPTVRVREILRPTDRPAAWSTYASPALPKDQNAKVLRNLAAKMHRIPTRARRISTKRAQRGISHALAGFAPDVDDVFQLSRAQTSPCDRFAPCLSFFP